MALGYLKRRADFNLLSEIKNHQLTLLAKTTTKEKEDPQEPGLRLSSELLRDAFGQTNFDARMKGIKRARRELEIDPFFKSMLDDMIAYQTSMKDIVIISKGQKRIDTTTADQIRNTVLGCF